MTDPLEERLLSFSRLPGATANTPWVIFHRSSLSLEQGWKLHVSATIVSAVLVLDRVFPILIKEGVQFKVAANLRVLSDLNEGLAGLSQIGKFITVYPQ